MHLSTRRSLRTFVLALVLALGMGGLTVTGPVGAMPIEGFPNYHPQTTCSPRPKPGTLMLEKHLLKRYKGSGSLGISRACTASGTSEHKEGRAFDWALNAGSKRDRGYAGNFLHRLLRTDKAGHRKALARRMGIMYVIWNDHIWSASKNYRKRRYVHPACARIRGCSKTLRHRDHMHISLTWPGARARTSWYVNRRNAAKKASRPKQTQQPKPKPAAKPKPAPKPKPATRPKQTQPRTNPKTTKPSTRKTPKGSASSRRRALPKLPDGILDLRKRPYRSIRVPADGEMVETSFKLREGVTYSLTAAGLYTFGNPDQVGDAVCTWSGKDDAWVAEPSGRVRRHHGRLALAVNGSIPFESGCRGSHTYRTAITPTRDQTLRLRVALKHPASSGSLVVVVGRKTARVAEALPTYADTTPAPAAPSRARKGFGLISETVAVPGSGSGIYTRAALSPDATYRMTVSGVVRLGDGVLSDGQCLQVRGTWYRRASLDPRTPQADHGNLYVDGAPFSGRSAGSSRCADGHTTVFSPDASGRLRLQLWDPLDGSDNRGDLSVTIQRVTPIPTPTAPHGERPRVRRTEWKQTRDWFEVDAGNPEGTISTIKLRKGVPAQVFIRGSFRTGGREADASCVKTDQGWATTDPSGVEQDPLNVWIDDQPVVWRALGPQDGCSSEHRYTTRFTPTKNGPVRISVFDLDHRDNKGTFQVTVLREAP